MSDEELITWLRKYSSTNAADRIEALRAALDRADALAAALREAITWDGQDDEGVDAVWLHDANAALAAYEARK